MSKLRLACCYLPEYPIALWVQEHPSIADLPLAIAQTSEESSPIVLCNQRARDAGITGEMTVAQAHTLCPNLRVKIRDLQHEKFCERQIVTQLQECSPFVQVAGDGCFFLNASGLRFIYDSEAILATHITTKLASQRLAVAVGIGSSKFVARLAAQTSSPGEVKIIADQAERQFLQQLSIDYLPVSADTRLSLHELGLRTIGQVRVFPVNELMERFALDGMALSRLANGDDPDTFIPEFPPELLVRRIPLTFAVYSASGLLMYVERLLERLLERLRQAGRCCRTCLVIGRLEDHTDLRITVALDRPAAVLPPFMRQLRQSCETIELNSGIVDVTVAIPESSVLLLEQLAFQQRSTGACETTDTQFARLAEEHALARPKLQAAHLPERHFTFIPAIEHNRPEQVGLATMQPYTGHSLTGLRLLQPPMAGDIIATGAHSMLLRVKQALHKVDRILGPWKLSGGWWQGGFDRLYYEVQTTECKLYLVFFDRLASRWFVQGVFD